MRTNVFGLDVALPWLVEGCPPRPWTGLRAPLEVVDADEDALAAGWDGTGAQSLVDEPGATVEESAGAYLVSWEGVGRFLLTADSCLVCARGDTTDAEWQRYLTAQVLPLAAVMAGIEVLHASAVVLDGAAVGVVGASGAGKSTTARALVDAGGALLTDDVLALTRQDGRIVCHPGPDRLRVGPSGAKAGVDLPATEEPAPLSTLFFLDRTADGRSIGAAVGFRELAAATFNLLVRTPERLERHLDLAAALAAEGIAVWAEFPAETTPEETAGALVEWLARREA